MRGAAMTKKPDIRDLTRREREIMEVVYRRGRATAAQVTDGLSDRPANATVRTMLHVLEGKGYLRHEREKGRFIYFPTIPLASARRRALEHLLETFFQGAEASAVISILRKSDARLSEEDLDSIAKLIDRARKEGR
jgi:BlaI family penicillinase repressor